ncbi:MAG: LysR family transcriptional regulator [Deltaproteobacteria bacterium]|nr:LysR family transcriptional regulator [Deltaproteobacteria bacterium]
MNHLEIKHLRMIRSIAETGNMTKSADMLFLSQSALSQQLKDIESKLKVDLFFRTRRKMILTATGKKLLQTAEHVIEALDDAELEIAKRAAGDRGELKVGTQCIFCYKWLPRVMEIFQDKFPNIEFEIGNSEDLARELEAKKFDLIITAASSHDDNYAYSPLFKDQMVCILPENHPFSAQPCINLQDFSKMNLISHREKGENRFYQAALKPRGIEPKRLMTVGQPLAIIEMVASGFGVGVFPRWAVKDSLMTTGIIARPITRSGLPITWDAAFLRNTNIPVFQDEFINIVSKLNLTDTDR